MSPLLTPTEVGRILGIAQPKMIITCDPLLPLVQAALSTMENQVQIKFFIYPLWLCMCRSPYTKSVIIYKDCHYSVIMYNDRYSWFLYIMANFFQSVYIMTEILVCL